MPSSLLPADSMVSAEIRATFDEDDEVRVKVETYHGIDIFESHSGFSTDRFGYSECIDDIRDEIDDAAYDDRRHDPECFGDDIDGVRFADPGGQSALRAATDDNPRNLPCPSCGCADRLTPIDVARGYQCDPCADQAERGGF